MGWFRKKREPCSEYEHALDAEISSLQDEIKRLSAALEKPQPLSPAAAGSLPSTGPDTRVGPPGKPEPVFEPVDRARLEAEPKEGARDQLNDVGLRKLDLPSLWDRFIRLFRPPPAANPKLVQYLAAGSIQGLRPLRYEKRVARNRLIITVVFFLLVLWGVLYAIKWRH